MSYEGVRPNRRQPRVTHVVPEEANNVEVFQPEEHRAVCTLCGQY